MTDHPAPLDRAAIRARHPADRREHYHAHCGGYGTCDITQLCDLLDAAEQRERDLATDAHEWRELSGTLNNQMVRLRDAHNKHCPCAGRSMIVDMCWFGRLTFDFDTAALAAAGGAGGQITRSSWSSWLPRWPSAATPEPAADILAAIDPTDTDDHAYH